MSPIFKDTADALEGIPLDEKTALLVRLKQLQRVFRLTDGIPNRYGAMRKRIDEGLDSAQAIAAMGEEAFCAKCAEGAGVI